MRQTQMMVVDSEDFMCSNCLKYVINQDNQTVIKDCVVSSNGNLFCKKCFAEIGAKHLFRKGQKIKYGIHK